MNVFIAMLLGVIQGLTEFLPVSSSGHLVLLQKIFGITEPAIFFNVMVHVGTLTAVFVVLRRDIWNILQKPIQPLTAFLIIGTIPAVIFALIFKDKIEGAFVSGRFLGFAFLITAALLSAAELLSRRSLKPAKDNSQKTTRSTMLWQDALIIGLMQAVAIIPGISRSGATLSGALSRKLNRDFAARFSFLLSIPAILGALVLQIKDIAGDSAVSISSGISAAAIIAGTLTAAVTGFFAISFMIKIVREKSLWGFALYTAVLGVLILIDQYAVHLIFTA
jgi:undecaprenyl-diphosphatase